MAFLKSTFPIFQSEYPASLANIHKVNTAIFIRDFVMIMTHLLWIMIKLEIIMMMMMKFEQEMISMMMMKFKLNRITMMMFRFKMITMVKAVMIKL